MSSKPFIDHLIRGLIIASGVFLLLVVLLFLIRNTGRSINWRSSGFLITTIRGLDNDWTAFLTVDPEDFISATVPARGDTLTAIDDSAASLQRWSDLLETPHPPGKEAAITFSHAGEQQTTTVKTRLMGKFHYGAVVFSLIIRILIYICFVLLSFWIFFKREDSPAVRTLTLYWFSVAGFMGLTYLPSFTVMAIFQIPHENVIFAALIILTALFGSFWLLLNMVFPKPYRMLQTRPCLAYGVCFLPQAILLVLAKLRWTSGPWIAYALYAVLVSQIIYGLLILRHNNSDAASPLEKRQTRFILWGTGVSLVLFLMFGLNQFEIVPIFSALPLFARLMSTNILFLFLLTSPISFASASGRSFLRERVAGTA
ncbi:MAG TPA: hypothetical protein VF398_01015 [bacterium]|jgi:hypothetical protein